MESTGVIVVAGGRGERFGGAVPKTLLELDGRTVLERAVSAFAGRVDHVVVVVPSGREAAYRAAAGEPPGARFVIGGVRRQDSVRAGLAALPAEVRWVLVHDAARPLISGAVIDRVLAATRRHGAAIPVTPVHASVKRVDADGQVVESVARDALRLAQTPQGARRDLLAAALDATEARGDEVTDEAGAISALGEPVRAVAGDARNLKITTPDDLVQAEAWLRHGEEART